MPSRVPVRHKQAGLSLLEVLIATVVLSSGLLAVASLQVASLKSTHNAYQVQQATWLAHDFLERMRANKSAVYSEHYLVSDTASTVSTAAFCAAAPPKNCNADVCNSTEVAQHDVYRVLCGYGNSDGINNVLMNARVTTTCLSGDCNSGINFRIDWKGRTPTKNAVADSTSAGTDDYQFNLQMVM